MCYYTAQNLKRTEYIRLKHLEKLVAREDFLERDLLSGFDYNLVAVLRPMAGEEDFEVVQMEWGFIPQYLSTRADVFGMRNGYKDARGSFRSPIVTLNAVGEEILNPGKIYRQAALTGRCLILGSGFFEWRHLHRVNKRTGQPNKTAEKYPYFISLRDRQYFFMAGLFQPWTDRSSGEQVESCTVVTTKANSLMEQIHNSKKRMPVILPEDLAWEWLLGNPDEKRIQELAGYQHPSEAMDAYSIRKDFRETNEPAAPFCYEELPPLVFPATVNAPPTGNSNDFRPAGISSAGQGRLF